MQTFNREIICEDQLRSRPPMSELDARLRVEAVEPRPLLGVRG